jgi:hypothetical protein
MQVNPLELSSDQLLLDPNNYRFHDLSGFKEVSRTRYAEAGVQDRALQFLRETTSFNLGALRDSIISNGFVPFEQIAVEAYQTGSETPQYVVVEGNRRVAAIKLILRDHQGGSLTLGQDVLDSITKLTVIEIVGNEEERSRYQKTLMAIRHVAGIQEWGPYQQAKGVGITQKGTELVFERSAFESWLYAEQSSDSVG